MSAEAKTFAHHDFFTDGNGESFTIHNPPPDCSQTNCLIKSLEKQIVGKNILARCVRSDGSSPRLETASGPAPQFPEPVYITPCGLNPSELYRLIKEKYGLGLRG